MNRAGNAAPDTRLTAHEPERASHSLAAATVVGVDLGGTHLRVRAADWQGSRVSEWTEPVSDLTAAKLAVRVRELVTELCPDGPTAVAVGLPGPVASDGEVGHLVNLPALSGAPLRALLQEELAVPVVLENDVNLAALGEQRRGHGTWARDVAFIAIGTGVGMGIVAGGRILRGARGGAGELGSLPLSPECVVFDPHQLGPLEAVAGGAGLASRWAAHTGRPSNGRDVFASAAAADPTALALLDEQAVVLAMGVRAVQALLDPQLIVFGGGIGARQDVFARVKSAVSAHGVPSPELALSALGWRAALVGAVEAALDAARDAESEPVEP
jgi:predicted NBD/HSP70 family sugar kinase